MTKAPKVLVLAVTIAAIITLLFSGCQFVQVDPEVDKETVVAEVAGENIKKAEFTEMFDVIKEQYELQFGKEIWEKEIQGRKYIDVFKEKVLDAMVDIKIQQKKANELGIAATEEEVEAELAKAREYFDTEEKFNEFLSTRKMTLDYFKNSIRTDLTINKLKDKLTENITVTEEDAAIYYSNNVGQFETVRASHILVDTEEEAKNIQTQIKEGKDFAELAKQYSKDTGTKERGGDLDFFKRGDMVEEFEKAAFALSPGEVSEIVKTQYGYHIIKLTEKKREALEDVMEELKNSLIGQKKDKEYENLLEEMRTAANIKKNLKNL
ncbi:MAG: peptidylprolyl isomerase [Bacillota bacterium]